jgi:alcohol dehydrogenase class IV
VGIGRAADLPQACAQAGIRRPLLVTDSGLAEHAMVTDALERLRAGLPDAQCFSRVKSNPTGGNIEEGVAAFRAGRHDGVVALGGGSALDAGKTIAFLSGQTRPLWNFEDIGDWWTRADPDGIAPIIALPTTAGTGSEVGRAAVVTDETTHTKKIIFHPKMLPTIAILDPELTVGLPPALTAAAGIDAFSHAFEAFFARGYHPLADAIALHGMRLVKQYLPRAFADGADREARMQMLAAAAMGATAFQKGLGGVHGLAHAIGALHDTHHGLTIGILLPYVLAFNAPAIEEPIRLLAATLELPATTPGALLDWLVAFRAELGIPHALTELGVTPAEADAVSRLAAADPSTGGNPRPLDAAAYATIFEAACEGRLP